MNRSYMQRRAPKSKRPKPLVPKNLGKSAPHYKTIPRDTEHMARIAGLGCLICGKPAQAHHVDIVLPKGAGPKVTDYATAPLCERHHTGDQNDCAHVGERQFWARHRIDIGVWIVRTLVKWYWGSNPDATAAINAINETHQPRSA